MTEVLMALLMLVGPIAVLFLLVLIPVAFGIMAYDVVASRKSDKAAAKAVDPKIAWERSQEAAENRIYLERGVARAFVIGGGLYSFRDAGALRAFLVAGIPLAATILTLIVGWYWERIAAAMLAVASIGAVYYGLSVQFDAGVWLLVTLTLIGPMMTAAVLFWLARREYEALELRLTHPELAPASARASMN
jgi:hypothetical protein